jgi:hypothetical protein
VNDRTHDNLDHIAELLHALVQSHFGDLAGFVLLVTEDKPEGGSRAFVRTSLCHRHAALAMAEIAPDYAARHGVSLYADDENDECGESRQ